MKNKQVVTIIVLFVAIILLVAINGIYIKRVFNDSIGNIKAEDSIIDAENQTGDKQEKSYIEKNLEAIKIIENEVIDIINGQGCLIRPETTILFGPDDKGNIQKIKDFERPLKVTSSGYIHCTEIIGELSNGDGFYIHARGPFRLGEFFQSIIKEAERESGEEKITVSKIKIKGSFDMHSEEEISEGRKRNYKKECELLGIRDENIEIKSESFSELTPEKVIGYSSEEDRIK